MAEQAPNFSNLTEQEQAVHALLNDRVDVSAGHEVVQVYFEPGIETQGIGSESGGDPALFDETRSLYTREDNDNGGFTTARLAGSHSIKSPSLTERLRGQKHSTDVSTEAAVGASEKDPGTGTTRHISRDVRTDKVLDKHGNTVSEETFVHATKFSSDGPRGKKHQTYEVRFTGTPEEQAAKKKAYGELVTKLALKKVRTGVQPGIPKVTRPVDRRL